MNWSKDNILFLIELIRERPAIWDVSSLDYRIKSKRIGAMEEVAGQMNLTPKAVSAKWYGLRRQYNRMRKKALEIGAGGCADAATTSKWFAYNEMDSLMDSNLEILTKEAASELIVQQLSARIPKLCGSAKKKRHAKNSEDIHTLQGSNKDRRQCNCKVTTYDDDIAAFGLSVADQLRCFEAGFQKQAKFEINKILCSIKNQNSEHTSNSSIETSQQSLGDYTELSPNPQSLGDYTELSPNPPPFKEIDKDTLEYWIPDESSMPQEITNNLDSPIEAIASTPTLPGPQQPILIIKNDGSIVQSSPTLHKEYTRTPQNSILILNNEVLTPPVTCGVKSSDAEETIKYFLC